MVSILIPMPLLCDRHSNCAQADAWATQFGYHRLEHPNQGHGLAEPYGRPVCDEPGCTELVYEWGRRCEKHEKGKTQA